MKKALVAALDILFSCSAPRYMGDDGKVHCCFCDAEQWCDTPNIQNHYEGCEWAIAVEMWFGMVGPKQLGEETIEDFITERLQGLHSNFLDLFRRPN